MHSCAMTAMIWWCALDISGWITWENSGAMCSSTTRSRGKRMLVRRATARRCWRRWNISRCSTAWCIAANVRCCVPAGEETAQAIRSASGNAPSVWNGKWHDACILGRKSNLHRGLRAVRGDFHAGGGSVGEADSMRKNGMLLQGEAVIGFLLFCILFFQPAAIFTRCMSK